MARIRANGISLEYEESGSRSAPTVLLVMGLGAQLVHWPDQMVEALEAAGYRVVRFDNRDVGLSEKIHERRAPHPLLQVAAHFVGVKGLAPYSLLDMANDSAALLEELDIEQAHVVGVSMGGMIGQLVSSVHPHLVRSFTCIMSTTGNPNLPRADRDIARPLLLPRKQAHERKEIIDQSVGFYNLIGTKDPERDTAELRRRIELAFDRCYYPAGLRRQISAIIATGDLRPRLANVSVPTLVIHGSDDPLAPMEGGKDVAAHIKGSKLEIIDGMGHDLPRKFLPRINELILSHIAGIEGGGRRQAAE